MSDATTHVEAPYPPEQAGLNVRPGADDDGWRNLPQVTLPNGTRLTLYKDGEGLRAAYDAIAHAKRRILLEVYILRDDATGHAFVDRLCERARAGVSIYFIYDSFGSDHKGRGMFRQMRSAGIHLGEFHPWKPWECRFSYRPWNRDHRKLLVIDDHVGGLGGLNIGDEYAGTWVAGARARTDWLMRDTSIGVVGPDVRALIDSFGRTWSYINHGGPIARATHTHALDVGQDPKGRRLGKQRRYDDPKPRKMLMGPFGLLASTPTLVSPLRPALFSLLRAARSRIRMIMAYFAPDDELVRLLCDAAKRGVKVQLIFASRSDHEIMMTASRSFYQTLMDAGIEIYERQGAVLHAKAMTVDGHIVLAGSTNLDYRSIEFNLELTAIIDSVEFASQLDLLLDHDLRFSRRITPESWRGRPMRDRFVQWAVSRMRYWL